MNLSLYLAIEFLHLNVRLYVAVYQVLAEPPLLILDVEDAGVVNPAVIFTDGGSPSELVNGVESDQEVLAVKTRSRGLMSGEGDGGWGWDDECRVS